ncbi:MAG: hypothetical protein IPI67_10740 [Myxococcales bacterium]|nr:hypothetical protein [Myxococcales bacterium]
MRRLLVRVVLVVAALAVIATSQPRWSMLHRSGGVVTLPVGQTSARLTLVADSSHPLDVRLRFTPTFSEPADSSTRVRVRAVPRGIKWPKLEKVLDASKPDAGGAGWDMELHGVAHTQPSHVDLDVVIERIAGSQALSVAWDAEAETGEKGDSTTPKSASVRIIEVPSAPP